MVEIILTRYDIFISKQIITHITSNLSATEIETAYGNRVRSRLREMLNLITFDDNSVVGGQLKKPKEEKLITNI